jgi:hypothetical protein
MKHSIQDIAKERLKNMHGHKADKMGASKGHKYDDYEEEEDMSADTPETTPASEEGAGKPMIHGKPGLSGGKPEGVAVMIGIGKPMMHGKHPMRPPHPMYAKHPGLGESIEDEEPVMGGKYGK